MVGMVRKTENWANHFGDSVAKLFIRHLFELEFLCCIVKVNGSSTNIKLYIINLINPMLTFNPDKELEFSADYKKSLIGSFSP